ncbi:MAG TPA: helix-turn-helix domain-containing protein [Allocoleopsis sp.]
MKTPLDVLLMTLPEVCEALDISRATLYRKLEAREIPSPLSQKINGELKWRRDHIITHLQEQRDSVVKEFDQKLQELQSVFSFERDGTNKK